MSDFEIAETLGVRFPLDVYFLYPRSGWPSLETSCELFQLCSLSLSNHLNRSFYEKVSHVSSEPQASRLLFGESAEVYSLHSAVHYG